MTSANEQQRAEQAQQSDLATALSALVAADCPGYVWDRVKRMGYLPVLFDAILPLVRGKMLASVNMVEVTEMVLDTIDILDGKVPPSRDRNERTPIPVGLSTFPPPIDVTDSAAVRRASILLDRSLQPSYWEGLTILRKNVAIEQVSTVVARWKAGDLPPEKAMEKVEESLSRIALKAPSGATLDESHSEGSH